MAGDLIGITDAKEKAQHFLRSVTSMPLLRRELQELAQKKRTYGLRCLVWVVFLFVFLLVYVEVTSRASTVMYILGRGNDMSEALFITLILTVYVLNPIMACTAITSEKEKQTLGLLIISKMSPTEIVVQKIFSHMLPLISLLLVSTPLFAIAYLFGGVSFEESMAGLLIMLAAIVQITTVAVFCSAMLESGVAAFWATYLVLAVVYFTLPIMHEMDMIDIDFGNLPDEEFMLFPIYQLAMVMGMRNEISDVLPYTFLTCLITLLFAIAARFAVVKFSYGGAFSFQKISASVWKEFKNVVRAVLRRPAAESDLEDRFAADPDSMRAHHEVLKQPLIHKAPISWREMKKRIVGSWKRQLSIIIGLITLVVMLLSAYERDTEEILAFFSLGGMIAAVLLVISVSCRLFAMERERQTLDSLLIAPITNRELVGQKIWPINRLILIALIPFFCLGVLNLFEADIRIYETQYSSGSGPYTPDWRRVDISVWSSDWYTELLHYLTCYLGCAFIYMHMVKWIAVYWGLRLNTQMKAMMASILMTLGICLIPMCLLAMGMIATGRDPDDFPLFFFSSPLIIPAINEFHDIYQIYRRSWFVNSSAAVILMNFAVYGSLTLLLRHLALAAMPSLLQRPETSNTQVPMTKQSPVGTGSGV